MDYTRFLNPTRRRRFTVEAGRNIYKDGAPFISVNREGRMAPADADAVTHQLAEYLNRRGARGWRGQKL